jgi:hypothetical protein
MDEEGSVENNEKNLRLFGVQDELTACWRSSYASSPWLFTLPLNYVGHIWSNPQGLFSGADS